MKYFYKKYFEPCLCWQAGRHKVHKRTQKRLIKRKNKNFCELCTFCGSRRR